MSLAHPLVLGAAAIAVAFPLAAQAAPPPDALPLSVIVADLEASGDVAYFDEIEWDSDGYWEIEYRRPDGAKVEVEIDPITGSPRR